LTAESGSAIVGRPVPSLDLAPLMKPASIAVVGASQRMTRATRVVANLQRFGYAGRIYPINPKYAEIPEPFGPRSAPAR
jgi:acyl-CoA synthetase (NDP forming)